VIIIRIQVCDKSGTPIDGAIVSLRDGESHVPIEGASVERTDQDGYANFHLPNSFDEMTVGVWVHANGPNDPQLTQEIVLGKQIVFPVVYRP
jgi:hypothetical protein